METGSNCRGFQVKPTSSVSVEYCQYFFGRKWMCPGNLAKHVEASFYLSFENRSTSELHLDQAELRPGKVRDSVVWFVKQECSVVVLAAVDVFFHFFRSARLCTCWNLQPQ